MSRVIAIRPEPGLAATLARGRELGLEIAGWPMFEVRPVAWEPPSADGIDGVLLGSVNALRHGGAAVAQFADRPAYTVGAATAAAARDAGFTVALEGSGGLQSVLDALSGHPRTLLRLAGAQRVALKPPLGIVLVTRVVYESAPVPMPPELAEALRSEALVLLHSAEAARHFAGECERLGIDRSTVSIAALGPRIAEAAGTGWREMRSAETPVEAAILALAQDMCH